MMNLRNLLFCIIFGAVAATIACADVDITVLPDLGIPATATDSIVTYDSSAVEGSRLTEKKFTGTSDESLRGDGTMPDHGIMGHEGIQFDISGTPPTAHSEGKLAWNDNDKTLDIHTEVSSVELQVGQEMFLRSTNSTGSTLSNGDIVYVSGALGSRPQITLSDADIELTTERTIGMVTADILTTNTGYVTIFGLVRDVDTSSGSDGDPIYVSSTAGEWQTTAPAHPAHKMRIGYIIYSHATEGVILVSTQKGGHLAELWEVDISSPTDKEVLAYDNASSTWKNSAVDSAFFDFYNGTFQESFDALVTSNGTTITLSLQSSVSGDLTMRFSDGTTALDCTPAKTIALTAGTDNSPQSNFIYIPQSTKVLTKSTTNWPSTEHIKVGYFYVQSAVTVQSNGAMINQNWNDEAASDDNQGHVTHLGAWIRSVGAKWFSGCDGGGTSGYLTPYAGGASIQVNAGVISQTHKHTYPSHDTSGTDVALVYNYPSDAWKEVDDINDMLVDSTGTTLTNRYYNIIIGGVANKSGEYSPLVVKLPSGSYNSSSTATNDTSNYTDYTMPREFNKESSTGFLIARITIRNQSDTTFTVINTQDLRGQDGATAVGSIGGTVLVDFADNQFTIYNNTDATKVISFLASAITTGNTRTITMADVNVDLADIVTNSAKVTNATHTGDVAGDTALAIASDAVDEMHLNITNTPTTGYALSYAGSDNFTWIELTGGAETNSLETTITGIADTEIFVGDGPNSGTFAVVSGDATLSNTGTLTIGATFTETDVVETLSANWVNTANPWANGEVSDDLDVNIVDSGALYTATTVEGAFAENRPLINANTAKTGLSNDAVTPDHVLSTGQTDEYCLTYESTGTTWEWQACGGGSGDMLASTYDPATIAEQLVGLIATQTLTNKTLTSPNINEAVSLTSTATELNLLDGIITLSGSNTGDEVAATTTVAGIAELATSANVVTGTETDTIVTPDTLTDKMAAPGAIGGTTPATGTFTTVTTVGADTYHGVKITSNSAPTNVTNGSYTNVANVPSWKNSSGATKAILLSGETDIDDMADDDWGDFSISSNVASLDVNSVDSDQYVDGSIDSAHLSGVITITTTGVIKGRAEYGADITVSTAHDTAELHGVFYHFTVAATVTLDAAADAGFGAQVCYRIRDAAEAAVIDLDGSEKINLSGTALAVGVAITATGAGESVCMVSTTDSDGSGTDGWEAWGPTSGWASE